IVSLVRPIRFSCVRPLFRAASHLARYALSLHDALPICHMIMTGGMPAWSDGTVVDESGLINSNTRIISESLDAITQTPGSLMYRDRQWWMPIPPGDEGDILTMSADGVPTWTAP